MNDFIILREANRDFLSEFRLNYLNSLAKPQELFLEMIIWEAKIFSISVNNEQIGYFQIKDKLLLEYYIDDEYLPYNTDVFLKILEDLKINSIYCKSFDDLLLTNSIKVAHKVKEIGYLFRDFTNREFIEDENVSVRFAHNEDIVSLSDFIEGIFENIDELKYVISNNNLLVFEIGNEIIGFGIFQKTVPEFNWFDIGMAVKPAFRKKGIGTYIISYMKNYCFERKWIPTCGCDINNIASKKTLEKAGIYSKHRLYEFEV